MSNITINYKNSTIEITKSFEKQASVYGSQAYNELREARAEFPTYRLAMPLKKSIIMLYKRILLIMIIPKLET